MPLPFIICAGAAVAGITGVGAGIHGGIKMKNANDTLKDAERENSRNIAHLKDCETQTMKVMDTLGTHEMDIIASFKRFSNVFERIKNHPQFETINLNQSVIVKPTLQEIEKASVGASVLLGGLGGAALGTAGGFAAAGGTTAAVMAVGTASTGTAISTLSGVAATNATLAALGGGSIAAGGGGMAMGSVVLGTATLGVGLLVGGIIFNIVGSTLSSKAENAQIQVRKNKEKIDLICEYLEQLKTEAERFDQALLKVQNVYLSHLQKLESVVENLFANKFFLLRLFSNKVNYHKFSSDQQLLLENTVELVSLLYTMCKVQIVKKSNKDEEMNEIEVEKIQAEITKAQQILAHIA